MRNWRARPPSPTTVIALVALSLAIGGSSYAAVKLQSVKVVGPVVVRNGARPVRVAGDVGMHSDRGALPISGAVSVSGGNVGVSGEVAVHGGSVGISGGSVDVKGPVELSPERVLASGDCNSNGSSVVATVPNTPGLRIASIVVTQTIANSGDARLSMFAPGMSTSGDPLTNVFGGDVAAGVNLPSELDFGSGLTSSATGNWTFRCGSTTNAALGASESIWMALGS